MSARASACGRAIRSVRAHIGGRIGVSIRMPVSILVGVCVLTTTAIDEVSAQRAISATTVRMMLDTARQLRSIARGREASGEHRAAANEYGRVINAVVELPTSADQRSLLADAHFGRASALLQLNRGDDARDSTATPDASTLPPELARAIADYDDAIQLDSSRFHSAANNNAGLLLRDLGRHRDALNRFLAATRSPHPARGSFLVNAGTEYSALARPDSAASMFRAALAADSTLVGARAGLLRAFLARPSADSLLRLASRWSAQPSHSSQVADVMYAALVSGRWQRRPSVNGTIADSCLLVLASSFATMELGPPDIARSQVSRLRAIPVEEPSTRDGVNSLLAAYATPPDVRTRTRDGNLPGAEWWARTSGREGVWSTLLGSIGRWYDAREEDTTAVTYYEAALGIPWRYEEMPMQVDIDLVFPLALLYAEPAAMRADPNRLERFMRGVFGGKSIAYQSQDATRIRRFHSALGAFFASRGEWQAGIRGAIFQLENMRSTTRRINASAAPGAEPLRDAPELLDQLVVGYCRTGATAKATALHQEVQDEYRRLGRPQPQRAPCAGVRRP